MVELRKRPQRDPPAPAPAPKKSRSKATTTTTTETKPESSTAAPTGVVGKAKRAAAKVKEAVAGPSEGGETEAASAEGASVAKQPSVQEEPETQAVEAGETGMIPETAGTAPSVTTVPGGEAGSREAGSAEAPAAEPAAATVPPVTAAVEGKRGRGKKGVGAAAPVAPAPAPAATPVSAPAPEVPMTEATTTTGDAGTATMLPNTSTTEGKAIRSKAKNLGMGGSSTAAPAAAAATTTTATPTDPAAAATTSLAPSTAVPIDPVTEESRPPATEDLENPPEKGKIDTSSTTATTAAPGISAPATTTTEPADLSLSPSSVGKQIPQSTLSTLGGQITLHTTPDTPTTFADLLSRSTTGLIIFTYPRASTPGCTTQACSFRDNHDVFTKDSGYTVYGLSTDTVKANTGFASKQSLNYGLICDVDAGLTGALGMKKAGNAKGTLRGVVVVDKTGLVRVWFQGGPGKTVDAVKEFLAASGGK